VVVEGREVVNVSSNDYLGLAGHEGLVEAARVAMEEAGVGAGASRLITGNVEEVVRLEEELGRFHGVEAVRVFNSGYAANTGVVPVLVEREDVVFSDELNHASIIDGCRLSRARVEVYRHGDVGELEEKLRRVEGRRKLVVTESLFSMDGDVAPLAQIREVATRAGAMLMVDDAHAVGAMGDGRGLGVAVGADVVVGTLGKAFGSAGAYVMGSRALVALLWNRARSLVFSTGLPVPVLAAARAAVGIVASGEGQRLRERLAAYVARIGRGGYIVPLMVGDERRTMDAMRAIMERGLLVQGIRPPTVPEGTSRLRLSLSAALEERDLELVAQAVDAMFVPRGTSR
jgi:8-amino-7-oxononanoate synthase